MHRRKNAWLASRLTSLVAALLIAVQVVRSAAVNYLTAYQPASAAWFWRGHPQVEIALGMTEIAGAARNGQDVSLATFSMMKDAAIKSPLSPEPFLVEGVRAQTAGNREGARRVFREAQRRDPRSIPAAYFLAEDSLRAGKTVQGLEQMALLGRLLPQAAQSMVPFLATYAQNRTTWPQMRAFFRNEKGLEEQVLLALAQEPQNIEAILALADPDHRKADSIWLPQLLNTLVADGEYAKARALWVSVGGGKASPDRLFDADFSTPGPPPPFNWRFVTSEVGLAERQPGKKLHALFYGNQDGVLATQLLMLAPGAYRLQMRLMGAPAHPELLSWTIRCDKPNEAIDSAGFNEAAGRGWTFRVPQNCPAQWLELSGRSEDVAQQSDVTVGGMSFDRVGLSAH